MSDRDWNKKVKEVIASSNPEKMKELLSQLLDDAKRLHKLSIASMMRVAGVTVSFDLESVLSTEKAISSQWLDADIIQARYSIIDSHMRLALMLFHKINELET